MSSCAMTRPIPTSSSRRLKNTRVCISPGASKRTAPLFRTVFSGRTGAPHPAFHSQALPGSKLHGRFDAQSSAALPAVLHSSAARRAVNALTTDERTRSPRATRYEVPRGPPPRLEKLKSACCPANRSFLSKPGYPDLLRTLEDIEM